MSKAQMPPPRKNKTLSQFPPVIPIKRSKKKAKKGASVYTHKQKFDPLYYAGSDAFGLILTPMYRGFKPGYIRFGSHVRNGKTVAGSAITFEKPGYKLIVKLGSGYYSYTLMHNKKVEAKSKVFMSIIDMQAPMFRDLINLKTYR